MQLADGEGGKRTELDAIVVELSGVAIRLLSGIVGRWLNW
jgi:hypothetical protein